MSANSSEAKSLFERGVNAIKQRDMATGRKLITQSLRLNDQNDMAWLWLSRTVTDHERQVQCVERALSINPNNTKAQAILKNLHGDTITATMPPTTNGSGKMDEIKRHMRKAELLLKNGDDEGAIGAWLDVLAIEVDHEEAMKRAVRTLLELDYAEDAEELLGRAIKAGTRKPSIYLTALDLAARSDDYNALDNLRQRLTRVQGLPPVIYMEATKSNIEAKLAIDLLTHAIEEHPTDQKLLMRMAKVYENLRQEDQASIYYNRSAAVDRSTPEGKEAEKKIQDTHAAPVITDKERGSIALAWREALGISIFFLLMAWQDAGLDLLRMSIGHWLGVIVGTLGGYLLITATSSPQQQPIATWFGGEVPESNDIQVIKRGGAIQERTHLPIIPPTVRLVIGGLGAVLVLLAFALVFDNAITLLFDPIPPTMPN